MPDVQDMVNALDPAQVAALRMRQAAVGGRQQGPLTAGLESLIPSAATSLATLPKRAYDASEQLRTTGQYDPGPALQASGLVLGGPGLASGPIGEDALGAGFWSPGKVKKLSQLIGQGKSRTEAAEIMGITRGMVAGAADRYSLGATRAQGQSTDTWSPENIQRYRELLGQGHARSDIAKAMGISPDSVSFAKKQYGADVPEAVRTPSLPQVNIPDANEADYQYMINALKNFKP